MKYKMIAIDMDGTLLNSKQNTSESNILMIQKALKSGVKVVLCTGRDYDGIIRSAKKIGLNKNNQYMIYFGGSVIQSYGKKILYQKTLKNENCESIANFLSNRKVQFELIDNLGDHYDSYQDWIEKQMLNRKLGIVKFIIKTHKHELDKLLGLMHTNYDKDYFIVKTSANEMELFPQGINKGSALVHLAKHLGISMNQVVAIGDMDNDIPMLKRVGLGIAMGNASAEVKKISNVETTDNDHDGVANAIREYVLAQVKTEVK